jgi:hypothetical protein
MKNCFVLVGLILLGSVCPNRVLAQNPDFQADFMSADCNTLKGVAYDNNNLNTFVKVNFFENSTLLGSVTANRPTQFPFTPIGPHAFEFPTPGTLKDGQLHTISARMDPVGTDMADSPRTIGPCGPTGFTIPNPKITTFEITKSSSRGSTQLNRIDLGDFATTTSPSLSLRVEIDHPDRVHFYRLGEIACPESVSDHPEDRMKNFSWQPYTQGQSFSFRLDTNRPQPYSTRCVYMEVNRTENENSASPAKGDSIVLAPAHLKTFTLTGNALKNFLDRAKAVGYKFTVTSHSFTPDPGGCPPGTVVNTSSLTKVGTGADFFEDTSAKLFDRSEPFLNPFWKLTGIEIPGNGASVTIHGPLSGRADDPFRTVGIRQGFKSGGTGGSLQAINPNTAGGSNFSCVTDKTIPRPFDTGIVTSITLEGPDDKQPENALFDPSLLDLKRLIRPLNPRP